MAGKICVGTSGWNYKHWRGEIYPASLKQREWLPYLAARFPAVEVNASFYRIPTEAPVEEWQRVTPSTFQFALKLWRGLTHYRKLLRPRDLLQKFFRVADRFEPRRRDPLLIQLPPNLRKDLDRLDSFLDAVHEEGRWWKLAVEFRHDSWLDPDVCRLLDRHKAAICLHDREGSGAAARPNASAFVYVRRHGPSGGQYRGNYSRSHLKADAEDARAWRGEGKTVYIFFNNDIGGHLIIPGLRADAEETVVLIQFVLIV